MTLAELVIAWNRWYDRLPEDWRFQVVLWPLVILGMLNMMLTVSVGFPFALLVVLGILCAAAVRIPYMARRIGHPPVAEHAGRRFRIEGAGWIADLNRRYEAVPELHRGWVPTVILLIAGGINMLLTIYDGFPFGLLFLLVLLALVLIRAPYANGWLAPGTAVPALSPPAAAGPDLIDAPLPEPAALSPPEPPAGARPEKSPEMITRTQPERRPRGRAKARPEALAPQQDTTVSPEGGPPEGTERADVASAATPPEAVPPEATPASPADPARDQPV